MSAEHVMSNLTVNHVRLTWEEAAAYYEAERNRVVELASILQDLDRCEHGRHEGDDCNGCEGPSVGNPCMVTRKYVEPLVERMIGYDLSGRPIVVPKPDELSNVAENWRQPY